MQGDFKIPLTVKDVPVRWKLQMRGEARIVSDRYSSNKKLAMSRGMLIDVVEQRGLKSVV